MEQNLFVKEIITANRGVSNMSSFIVTVDTEGDDLWNWSRGENIKSENASYIPKFQELCEVYGVKPVYLVNYEMAMNDHLVNYLKPKFHENKCEIGMHCHAWNTPPEYDIEEKYLGNPYITEYPFDIMYQKMKYMTDILEQKFEHKIVSHRAGRWASNPEMFSILKELGYKVDCSWVSHMNLLSIEGATTKTGFDYSHIENKIYEPIEGIIEVPMTSMKLHHCEGVRLRSKIKHMIIGEQVWLRTAVTSVNLMKQIIDKLNAEENEYIEFMIHSSELMPGGSPYFKDDKAIEEHFKSLSDIFKYAQKVCYFQTLDEFVNKR